MSRQPGSGGARSGAGRPKGIKKPISKTRLLAQEAAKKGITPLEVLLDNMRWYHEIAEREALKIKGKEELEENADALKRTHLFKSSARECAKDAAPFMHPRLANVEANVNISNVEAELTELE